MTAASVAAGGAATTGRRALIGHRFFDITLIVLLATSGVVFMEPAPYDILALAVIALFVAAKLPVSPGIMPLLVAVVFFVASGFLAATRSSDFTEAIFYVVVTAFLAANSIFFALVVARDPCRSLRAIMAGYVVAAVLSAAVAVGSYFGLLPSSETFLLYGRARGTFEDPNVMGPFLIPPTLYLLSRILTFWALRRMVDMGLLLLIVAAIFLSFSRGAWGHFLLSGVVMVLLHFIVSRGDAFRARIVLLTVAGTVTLALVLAWIASIEDVRTLLVERARLIQDYDAGQSGRFARQADGVMELARRPLGFGPGEFGRFFGEDPHNIYLKAFAGYGWLAGLSYVALVATTLAAGFRHAFRRTPWQLTFQVVYASFVGLAALGVIIDTDRWRHFWLLLGLLWGMMAAAPPKSAPADATAIDRAHRAGYRHSRRSVAQPG